jgi:hypothetical protein
MNQGDSKCFDWKINTYSIIIIYASSYWKNYQGEAWNVRYLFQGLLLHIDEVLRNFPLV